MSFNIGDRVIPIDVDDLKIFGEGTIVANNYSSRQSNDIIGYYINFDSHSGPTYNYTVNDTLYLNIYMMYPDRFELIGLETSRPPLPADPRLRGIALKIRELDEKFKRRQEVKAKSIADALAVGAIIEEESQSLSFFTGVHRTIYRDDTISIRPSGHIISGNEATDNSY